MSSTGLPNLQALESDTLPGLTLPGPATPTEGVERSILDTVLELCDETSSQLLHVHPELPTFAEQSYTDHQIDLVPANKELKARERSLRESGDWTALAQLLIERAELTRSEAEAARLLLEAAELYEVQIGNLASAQAIALQALKVDPRNMGAAGAIEKFAQHRGDWLTLIESFKEAAESLNDSEPSKAGELWVRLACAHAVARRDAARAFATLGRVRSGRASDMRPYLDALESTIRNIQDLDAMLGVCSRIGDETRSARLLSRAIAMSQSVVERANYHHLIAVIELNRDEDAAAEWHWLEALRLDCKRQDVREALGALFQERGEYRKALALLDEARAMAMHADARARYAMQAAQIYKEQFGENTRAVDLCAVALQLEPGHQDAAMQVVQRYYEQRRWAELAPVLDALLNGSGSQRLSKEELSEFLLIAGECASELDHFEEARMYYGRCLTIAPRQLDAILGCARASLASGDAGDAIAHVNLAVDLHEVRGDSTTALSASLVISAEANRKLGKIERAAELYLF